MGADVLVIGAGVVGLAVAARLGGLGREVIVVERDRPGGGVSSRNSGVIHAGLHCSPGSMKARLCVAGRARLYRYCEERAILHRRLGKLIVATSDTELPALARLLARGRKNGVGGLRMLTGAEARRMEPALRAAGALHSPETGIVDPLALVAALEADMRATGGQIARSEVSAIGSDGDDRPFVRLAGGERLAARCVINAAGLGAAALARTVGLAARPRWLKGNYVALTDRSPFGSLIYPLPEPGGLGIHLTLDMAGAARFGPDVEPVEAISHDVDAARLPAFYQAVRRYYPDIRDGSLAPAYAGVRPKIAETDDFLIARQGGMVHLLGIDSPGLTAALAIADAVAAMLGGPAVGAGGQTISNTL
jgi:L-2-hydroxyglutarate oxidase LhgO